MKSNIRLMLVLCGTSGALWSQEKSQPDANEVVAQAPLVVQGDAGSLPEPLRREAEAMNRVSGGASLHTAASWSQQKNTNIKDLLDGIPGVFVQPRNGAESARISIRGSGLGRQFQGGGLQLQYDGIPLNTADGSFDFQAIDPWLTDYVTVHRGANGMGLGSSTLGGVVNFGTTQPQGDSNHLMRLAAGSFGTRQGMFEFNQALGQHHAMRLRGSHFNQNGFRVQNQQRSNRLDWQHVYQAKAQTTHKTSVFHLNTHAELPSSLSKALLFADPRQSRGFNINGNFHRDLTVSRVAHRIQHQTANQAEVELAVFVAAKRLTNPVFTYIDRDSDDVGLQWFWQRGFNRFSVHSQFGSQDEWRRENESGQPGAERLQREQKAQTSSVTYQRQQPLGSERWLGTLALQGVYAVRDITEVRPEYLVSDRSYHQFNPRLGLLYQGHENQQWFANLSRSFEAPTFAELNNGNRPGINGPIKAQRADTLEVGTRGSQRSWAWDLAIYHSRLDHEFIRFRFPDGTTRSTNADRSQRLGLEGAVRLGLGDSVFAPGDQFTWQSSYQWNRFELDADPTYGDNEIPGIPEHYLQMEWSYEHPSGWHIRPNIEWVPSAYFIDLANSVRTEAYVLTGLSVGYEHPKGWSFFVDAKNLADRTYISTSLPIPDAGGTDGNYFYSGEGRAFYAGMAWRF